MKKATPFAGPILAVCCAVSLFAADINSPAAANEHFQANPLLMLPGMRGIPALAPSASKLPVSLISDVTNYPNPFDSRKAGLLGQTALSYSLNQDARVSIEIYDLLAKRVKGWDFAPGQPGARAGNNQILWDGADEAGRKVSKGGYIAEIQVETPNTAATVIRKIGVIH